MGSQSAELYEKIIVIKKKIQLFIALIKLSRLYFYINAVKFVGIVTVLQLKTQVKESIW